MVSEAIKIVKTTEGECEIYSLSAAGSRIAELKVTTTDDKPTITFEFLPAGDFSWDEAKHWVQGLIKLADVANGLTDSKPDVERLLHTPTSKEIDMAKAKAKAKAKKADAKARAKTGEKRETAAGMFCDLIMAGNLTDDKIFEKVADKFGLDKKKRSYVAWYRNKLSKDGKKPPAAKE